MQLNRLPLLAALAALSLLQLASAADAKASKSSQPKAASTASVAKPTGTATSGTGAGSVGASKIIKVVVGSPTLNKSLVFTPNDIKAAPGDIVQFQFSQINHTVTQSTFADACQPIQASDPAAAGIHSGFVPTTAGQATVPTFNMPINDTTPMFLYCAQGPHCQLGMVMAINAATTGNETLAAYTALAAKAKSNVPAAAMRGGVMGSIPAADAVPPPK